MRLFRARPGDLHLRAAMCTDPGRVRTRNEDACLVEPELGLYAVADGMGGHPAGDVAARAAVERLPELVHTALEQARGPWVEGHGVGGHGVEEHGTDAALEHAVVELNAKVTALAATDPRLTGMGTTLVLALVTGAIARVVHVGDSRAYLLRAGRLHRLTEDHSLAAALVDGGVADPEEATRHPFANSLTQAIGIVGPVRPSMLRFELGAGDRLLLCSDGLTKMLAEEEIEAVLGAEADPDRICRVLVDAANEAGGQDNISVVLIEVPGNGRP
jgi:protein phosphatase